MPPALLAAQGYRNRIPPTSNPTGRTPQVPGRGGAEGAWLPPASKVALPAVSTLCLLASLDCDAETPNRVYCTNHCSRRRVIDFGRSGPATMQNKGPASLEHGRDTARCNPHVCPPLASGREHRSPAKGSSRSFDAQQGACTHVLSRTPADSGLELRPLATSAGSLCLLSVQVVCGPRPRQAHRPSR